MLTKNRIGIAAQGDSIDSVREDLSTRPEFTSVHALTAFLRQETDEHRQTLEALLPALAGPFSEVLSIWEQTIRAGGKLLFFGNGGSASDAQHLAAELVIRYQTDRAPNAVAQRSEG